MAEPKDAIADNAAVDEAKFTYENAQASTELPPWMDLHWVSEEYWGSDDAVGTGVGCIRVHVAPKYDAGIGLSMDLEDKETGFDVGASVQMDREQALDLAQTIVDTVEVQG